MTPRRPSIALLLLVASLSLGAILLGCGLGDLPTAAPSGSAGASPSGPTTAEPTGSAAGASAGATPSLTPAPSPSPSPGPTPLVYVVQRGDGLDAIAKRFRTTTKSIGYWNAAAHPSLDPDSSKYDPNKIEVGWRLTIIPGAVLAEAPATAEPGPPTPVPSLTLGPAPTPPASGTGLLVTHGSRTSNVVALTFDMGGRTDPALAIVNWLVDHDIAASLFATGQLAASDATGQAVLQLAAAHPDRFTVGDHTWDHPDLTTLDGPAIASQLTRADASIGQIVGHSTAPLWRPPDGAQNATVRAAAAGAGFSYAIMWDVDTIDWKAEADGGPSADDIVTKVLAESRGGSIVLMHLGGWHTLEALPRIVDGLRVDGLEPVTLVKMLGL